MRFDQRQRDDMRLGARADARPDSSKNVSALQLATENDIAVRIDTVNLKNSLRDIETDCRDPLHDLAPPDLWGLSSTHIHCAHAPREEPFTADVLRGASPVFPMVRVAIVLFAAVKNRRYDGCLAGKIETPCRH